MDLSKAVSYNGWTSSLTRQAGGLPSSGYVVDEVQPSDVSVVAYLEKRALQDGIDAADIFLGGRQFSAIVTTFGSTPGDFWDKSQDFLAAFSPTLAYSADSAALGFHAFDFFQPTADISTWPTSTYPSGIPMRYYLRPIAPPAYVVARDQDGGVAGQGLSKQFRVSLFAKDPRKYLQTQQSLTITTATQSATHRGDYPTLPIITFSLTATGHSAFTLTIGGASMILNLSATSSGSYTFDYSKRTLVDGSGNNKASLLSTVGAFKAIEPGGITTYNYSNGTGISAPTLTYREAWA